MLNCYQILLIYNYYKDREVLMGKTKKKCDVTLSSYLNDTLKRFEELKEERLKNKPTDKEIQEGWKNFCKEFENRDILNNWTLKELRRFVKDLNNGLNQITILIRLFDSKFVNEVITPLGEYLIEKTIFEFTPSFGIRKSETGDYKIDMDTGFIVICQKEMVKYFCCGPLVPTWKVIKVIDPADVKIKKFDWRNCSLELKIICPKCKKALIV